MVDLGPTSAVALAHTEVQALASELDELSTRLLVRCGRLAVSAAVVLPGAALSPATAMAAEAAIGVATAGPTGLIANSAGLAATAQGMRTALALITNLDRSVAFASPMAESVLGASVRGWMGSSPGGDGVRALASTYAGTEGAPTVRLSAVSTSAAHPTSFAGLIGQLQRVNALADGTVQIQSLTGPDGVRRHVVYLPGTDSFDQAAVRSWSTNASIRLGNPTTHQAGVMAAMHAAHVEPGEPVLLVGHSQGGMVAAEIARDPGPFTVTHVVTAGSPIGDRPLPPGVGLVALENLGDPVPRLDGAAPADRPGQLRLRFNDGLGSPIAAHGLGHYVAGAEAAERSADPAVARGLNGLAGFLRPRDGRAETTTWELSRRTGE